MILYFHNSIEQSKDICMVDSSALQFKALFFFIYSLSHIHGLWLKYWRDRMLIPGVPMSYFSGGGTGVHSKFENVILWLSMKQMPWHPVIPSSQFILVSGAPWRIRPCIHLNRERIKNMHIFICKRPHHLMRHTKSKTWIN